MTSQKHSSPFSKLPKSLSSRRWIQRQQKDPFVHQAKQQGYRARSALKLLQLHQKFGFLRPGVRVLDLGCAPGGWCQVVLECLTLRDKKLELHQIVGVDKQTMLPLQDITFLQEDFAAPGFESLLRTFQSTFQVILSDAAPSSSGHSPTDQAKMEVLWQTIWQIAQIFLEEGGTLVLKIFHGQESQKFVASLKPFFQTVQYVKPEASRRDSGEIYVVALKFQKRSVVSL